MHCDAAIVSDSLNKHQVKKLKASGDDKDQQITELKQKLFETQKMLDEALLTRKSEGTALLQVEHFKADNARLVKLLASTKEFANFGEFAIDSGDVRYLDPDRQPVKCHGAKTDSLKSFKAGEEKEDWIPEEAFKVAHDFRNKHAGQIS